MLKLLILTLQKKLYEGQVDSLLVPATDGWLGILPNHIPLITSLESGEITIKTKSKPLDKTSLDKARDKQGKEEKIEIEKGFLEVRPRSEVVILATTHRQ